MTDDFRAGMLKAAETCSALSKKRFSDAESVQNALDRITMKAVAMGMGEAAIAILTACESPAKTAD